MELNKTKGQTQQWDPKVDDNQPGGKQTYTVNGQEMTGDQILESYNNLQSEFTKKSQKLAEYEKGNSWEDDELSRTKEVLKEMGFATVEELKELKDFKDTVLTKEQQAKADQEFDNFASKFNSLNDSQKSILKDLKKVYPDQDYQEILKKTGFVDQSLLEKSKAGQVVGWDNIWLPTQKEKPSINPVVAKRLNLKPSSELQDIRSKFNI